VTLRSLFSGTVAGTVGFEEELLLVGRGSWLPVDVAAVVAGIGDPRVKPELPACQLKIATPVHENVTEAVEELRSCRALVAAACGLDLAAIAAPVHPLLEGPTALSATERAAGLGVRYREVIGRQLVSSLQVHLAFGDADCTLGVYHALHHTSAIARFVHALAARLADLHYLGELQPPSPTWRIAENRWAALRDGVRGELLDLRTGESRSTLLRLHDLIDAAEPYAPGGLDDVRAMVDNPPVENLRELGPERVVPWLAEVFTA
jgi:gamma-glutamyl:cysteine ligase YbdK (ATP-grasp superfamily)